MADNAQDTKTRALHEVYEAEDPAVTAAVYDDWSKDYESHMQGVGYTHPAMVAGLLCRYQPAGPAPVLDAGCGTGILGELLVSLGYPEIFGLDASTGMLARAEKRGIYRNLRPGLLGGPLDYADDTFAAVASAGVFTQGHAPLDGLDELARITRPGGHIVFSIARTLLGAPIEAKTKQLADDGVCRTVEISGPYDSTPLSSDVLTARVVALEVL